MKIDLSDPLAVMALTMAAEARSDGAPGMGAVGCVIRNRVRYPGWWGTSWRSVCLAPWQFSCWNPYTVQQPADRNWEWMQDASLADRDVALAWNLGRSIQADLYPDTVGPADSYYDVSLRHPPAWAASAAFCAQIGSQLFYRTRAPAPQAAAPAPPALAPASEPEGVPGAMSAADALNAEELASLGGSPASA